MSEAARRVDPDAFAAFFARHFAFVWRSLRHIGVHADDADDLAQEVFIIAHRRLHEVGEPARGWLFGVARGVAANERRRRRRSRHRHDVLARDAEATLAPVPCEQADAVLALRRLLASLPEEQALALLLADLEGLEGSEIAEALGLPIGTVYSRIRLARRRLEQIVAEQAGGQRR
jgi:RNA polymerase sigma-70 factor (ECF subfamily)